MEFKPAYKTLKNTIRTKLFTRMCVVIPSYIITTFLLVRNSFTFIFPHYLQSLIFFCFYIFVWYLHFPFHSSIFMSCPVLTCKSVAHKGWSLIQRSPKRILGKRPLGKINTRHFGRFFFFPQVPHPISCPNFASYLSLISQSGLPVGKDDTYLYLERMKTPRQKTCCFKQ